jgi:redox-sensitive bicupin YhaK (pirin superfamily)
MGAAALAPLTRGNDMSASGTLTIRKADDRGMMDLGWLQTRHSFSFADYYDPEHMGYHSLRVINDDYIAAGQGFGTHPHRDMEIITYVVSGELEHKDSMGNGSIIRPDDVQRMSAGTGVTHSEFNPQADEPVHLLQIWIQPARKDITPSYEQKKYAADEKANQLKLVASPDGAGGSVTINQDARIYATRLEPGQALTQPCDPSRYLWIQVVEGNLSVNGETLTTGDGAAIEKASMLSLAGIDNSEVLIFDLA